MPTLEKPPVQQRDIQAAPSAVDQDARTVELSFSSTNPVEKFYGVEILSHAFGAVDLTRLNNGAALLLNHDPDQQIGVVESAWIQGNKGRALVRFGGSDQANEIFNDVVNGIRSLTSVGYVPNTSQRDPKDPDVITVLNWTPLEISVVAVPADPSVGIGRSFNHQTSMKPNESTNATVEPPAAPAKPVKPSLTRHSAAEEIRSVARAVYQRERRHAEHHDLVNAAERAIEEGKTVEDFYSLVRDSYIVRPENVVGAGPETSHLEVCGALGRSFTQSRDYQRAAAEQNQQRGGTVLLRIAVPMQQRDTFLGGALISVDKDLSTVVPHGVQMPTVSALMREIPTMGAVVRYTKETHFNPTASPTGQGQTKPELDVDYADVDAPVVKIAVRKKISDETLWDFPAVASFIDGRLRTAVNIAEDLQLLRGDGSVVNGAQTMTGFLNIAGLLNQPVGGDSKPDALAKAMTLVSTTAYLMCDAWVFNPNDWLKIKLLKDANNQYLGGGPFYAPYGNGQYVSVETLWGKPVVQTTAMTLGTALTGAFFQAAHPRRRMAMMLEMTNSNEDDFDRNLISVRAESRLGLTVEVPQAFCQVSGL